MWPNPQETADLVTFTEEVLNGTLFLKIFYAVYIVKKSFNYQQLHCKKFPLRFSLVNVSEFAIFFGFVHIC